MKAVILAAGYATRLYPLTENFPKPLLDVGGETILDALIDNVAATGMVDSYVIVSNHRFVSFFEDFAGRRKEDIRIVDDGSMTNEKRLGAVRDLELAVFGSCEGAPYSYDKMDLTDGVFVAAGDNLLDFSLEDFFRYAKEKKTTAVMCHEENDLARQQRTAIITLDEDGKVTSYEEKPVVPKGNLAVPPFYIYTGEDLELLPKALLDGCGVDAPGSLAAWTAQNSAVHAWKMTGRRVDIGDRKSLDEVRAARRNR